MQNINMSENAIICSIIPIDSITVIAVVLFVVVFVVICVKLFFKFKENVLFK